MSESELDDSSESSFRHRLGVTFEAGETGEEIKAWAANALEAAGLAKNDALFEVLCSRCDLTFRTFAGYAQFRLKNLGDSRLFQGRDSVKIYGGVDETWVSAARVFLDAASIKAKIEVSSNETIFRFSRFSDLASFRIAVENNDINLFATALSRIRKLKGSPAEAQKRPVLGDFIPM